MKKLLVTLYASSSKKINLWGYYKQQHQLWKTGINLTNVIKDLYNGNSKKVFLNLKKKIWEMESYTMSMDLF